MRTLIQLYEVENLLILVNTFSLQLYTREQSNEYIQSVARCLQMMLRVDEYRFAFVSVDGISTLVSILGSRVNFQVSFNEIYSVRL